MTRGGEAARHLGLFDTTAILVGIIIGASLFQSSPEIAASLPDLPTLLFCWLLGGVIAWVGALCYAELGTRFPHGGGDYVYLRAAFGPRPALYFAWTQLWLIRPGSSAFLAMVFGNYAQSLVSLRIPSPEIVWGAIALVGLTGVNLLGLREGVRTQRLLTGLKLLGIAALIVIGLTGSPAAVVPADAAAVNTGRQAPVDYSLAMILILYAYGGWNEVAYLAGDLRHARQHIPLTLGVGLGIVTLVYLLTNWAYAAALGWEGLIASKAVAADVLYARFGAAGKLWMSGLLCLTLLGAMNGYLLAGARFTAAFAESQPWAVGGRWIRKWDRGRAAPSGALLAQLLLALATLIGVGGWSGDPNRLVVFTAPPFWLGFVAIGAALIVIRRRAPDAAAFRSPAFPITPLAFSAVSAAMCWAGQRYAWENSSPEMIWTLAMLASGIVWAAWVPAEQLPRGEESELL